MVIRYLRPSQYIEEFYPGSGMCSATIINWIKIGKLGGTRTPTGRYLVCIDEDIGNPADRISELVRFLES
ncbi:hypothetical protein PYE51_04705 [Vibrio aestuarianus]|uniref:Uncharacterized protein n=1 Tax=Vibrio aestuarianus TaxID=28171 RepID=A0AAX3U6I5_9VIBR|nr:hypothetical protein [Vibrio aestuarianus]WGK82554.1 hypothetical protein PYE51_04705 [Vibrio aestuarianus]